jgi:2,5-diketo-D-gluconate reductase B
MHEVFANGAKIPAIGFGTYGMARSDMLRVIPAAVIDATRSAGLAVTANCAMAVGRVLTDPAIAEIAESHGRSIPQVVLRWLVQQEGVVAFSRTTNPDRIVENLAVFDFELLEAEMAAIRRLATPNSRIVDPAGLAPVWDLS